VIDDEIRSIFKEHVIYPRDDGVNRNLLIKFKCRANMLYAFYTSLKGVDSDIESRLKAHIAKLQLMISRQYALSTGRKR